MRNDITKLNTLNGDNFDCSSANQVNADDEILTSSEIANLLETSLREIEKKFALLKTEFVFDAGFKDQSKQFSVPRSSLSVILMHLLNVSAKGTSKESNATLRTVVKFYTNKLAIEIQNNSTKTLSCDSYFEKVPTEICVMDDGVKKFLEAKASIEKWHGRLDLSANFKRGTTIRISLPAAYVVN